MGFPSSFDVTKIVKSDVELLTADTYDLVN